MPTFCQSNKPMASNTRAVRAALFMRHCRQPYSTSAIRYVSESSHLAPSNFRKPLRFGGTLSESPAVSQTAATSTSESPSSIRPHPAFVPGSRPTYAHPRADRPPPTETNIPGFQRTPWTLVKSLFGWKPQTPAAKPAPFHIHNNPYRARKKWPPDFRTMHPKQQFHFEKTYRRRVKLKWARPTWTKWTKLLQHTLITFTIIYFVFICDPVHGQGTPFDGVCSDINLASSHLLTMVLVSSLVFW